MASTAFLTVDGGTLLNLQFVLSITFASGYVELAVRTATGGGTFRLTNPTAATVTALKALDTLTA